MIHSPTFTLGALRTLRVSASGKGTRPNAAVRSMLWEADAFTGVNPGFVQTGRKGIFFPASR